MQKRTFCLQWKPFCEANGLSVEAYSQTSGLPTWELDKLNWRNIVFYTISQINLLLSNDSM
jgi:hypothetical protein